MDPMNPESFESAEALLADIPALVNGEVATETVLVGDAAAALSVVLAETIALMSDEDAKAVALHVAGVLVRDVAEARERIEQRPRAGDIQWPPI